jgi:hypothetical protein
MDEQHAAMSDYTALIEELCARRSDLVQQMAADPEHVTNQHIHDLAALQAAFQAVEAEKRRADSETLRKEVQERTSTLQSMP